MPHDLHANSEDEATNPGTVTAMLLRIESGDDKARSDLFDLLYADLRREAARAMRSERKNHTYQPTDLVHEAFVRLVHQDKVTPENRAHFFAMCSQCMRRILVDYARSRKAQKRGGDVNFLRLQELPELPGVAHPDRILMLNLALEQLEKIDEPRARLAEMRLFAGLTLEESALALKTTYSTTRRRWEATRLWLQDRL